MAKRVNPTLPLLSFMDGAEFEVWRCTPTTKDGIPQLTLQLSPFTETMELFNIEESDLNFNDYSYGILQRTYPSSRILRINDNPMKPLWWGICTFDGTSPRFRTTDIAQIVEVIEENERLYKTIEIKDKEIARLRYENVQLATRAKEYFETQRSLTKADQPLFVEPPENMDTEVKVRRRQE